MADSQDIKTKLIHAGTRVFSYNPVMPPIYATSTYRQEAPGVYPERFDYARTGNPTRSVLEENLAGVEGCKFAVAFSSGCAALATLMMTLQAGDHVILEQDLYAGTLRLFKSVFAQFNISYTQADLSKVENLEKAFQPSTRWVLFETPTNPTLKVLDIRALSSKAHEMGLMVVVDNTFATAILQRPLDLGADVTLYSLTKYYGGHSDLVCGALCLNDQALYDKLLFLQNAVGAIPSPFDCFLALRGIKTLALRMAEHTHNATEIFKFLSDHPRVQAVFYPGDPQSPYYSTAVKQMSGFGGMVSFILKGGINDVKSFLSRLRIFQLAESLGGVESLIEVPSLMTHAYLSAEDRSKLGIADTFIRLSVGIEDCNDLIEDLKNALNF